MIAFTIVHSNVCFCFTCFACLFVLTRTGANFRNIFIILTKVTHKKLSSFCHSDKWRSPRNLGNGSNQEGKLKLPHQKKNWNTPLCYDQWLGKICIAWVKAMPNCMRFLSTNPYFCRFELFWGATLGCLSIFGSRMKGKMIKWLMLTKLAGVKLFKIKRNFSPSWIRCMVTSVCMFKRFLCCGFVLG